MAVSLVSTGVQFPDSTIQTSAASPPITTDSLTLISGVNVSSATTSFSVTGLDTQVTNNGYKAFLLFSGGWNNSQDNPTLYYSNDNGSSYNYSCATSQNTRQLMQDSSNVVGADSNTTRCWTNTNDMQAAYTYLYGIGSSTGRVTFWTQWWSASRAGASITYGWQSGVATFSTTTMNAIRYTFPSTSTGRIALYGIKYPTATS